MLPTSGTPASTMACSSSALRLDTPCMVVLGGSANLHGLAPKSPPAPKAKGLHENPAVLASTTVSTLYRGAATASRGEPIPCRSAAIAGTGAERTSARTAASPPAGCPPDRASVGDEPLIELQSSYFASGMPTWLAVFEGFVEVTKVYGPFDSRRQRMRYDQIAQVSIRRKIPFSLLIIESRGGDTMLPRASGARTRRRRGT